MTCPTLSIPNMEDQHHILIKKHYLGREYMQGSFSNKNLEKVNRTNAWKKNVCFVLPKHALLCWIANQTVSQTPRLCLNFSPLEEFYFNSKDRGVGRRNGFSLGSLTLKICFQAIFQSMVSDSRVFQRRLSELISIHLWLLCFFPLGLPLSRVSRSPWGPTQERKPERHEKWLMPSQGTFHTTENTASGTSDKGWVLTKNKDRTAIFSFYMLLKQNGSSDLKYPQVLCWRRGTRQE